MLTLILMAAFLLIVGAPNTVLGRVLRRWMAEEPARILSRLTPTGILTALVATAVGVLMVSFAESEGLRVLGLMLPEGLLWLTAFDIATLLEAFAAVATIAATARLRSLKARVQAFMGWGALRALRSLRRNPRASRRKRLPRRSRPPSTKGEGADVAAIGWVSACA